MFSRRKANAPPAYYDYYCPKPDKNNWLEYLIFPFVVITAVATTCAARYTYKQWLTADDTEKRSLRAYAFANQIGIKDFSSGNHASGGVIIRTMGQTPAYKIRSEI